MTTLSGIYAIKNLISGKLYIGSAKNLSTRRSRHFADLKTGQHKNAHLQNSWRKHGEGAFVFVVLLRCAPVDLIWFEQRSIDVFRGQHPKGLYNIGGTAGSRLGIPVSAANRAKTSERMKGNTFNVGRKLSAEHRARISAAGKGRPGRKGYRHSDEARAKIAAASRGNQYSRGAIRSAEFRAKISAATKGRVVKPEVRARISLTLQGHDIPPKTRQKIAETLRGRTLTSEHRAKVSKSLIGNTRWLGKNHSLETKRRMSEVKKGKKKSEATRARMSEAQYRRPPPTPETRLKQSLARKAHYARLREMKHHLKPL